MMYSTVDTCMIMEEREESPPAHQVPAWMVNGQKYKLRLKLQALSLEIDHFQFLSNCFLHLPVIMKEVKTIIPAFTFASIFFALCFGCSSALPKSLDIIAASHKEVVSPHGYDIIREEVVYSRWRSIISRVVRMPNGKEVDYDVSPYNCGTARTYKLRGKFPFFISFLY